MARVRDRSDLKASLFHRIARYLPAAIVSAAMLAPACNAFDEPPAQADPPIIVERANPIPGSFAPGAAPTVAAPGSGAAPPRQPTTCGNGVLEAGERCDDGNASSGDGCSSSCRPEGCGDAILQPDEACDDGNQLSNDGCPADCDRLELGWSCPEPGAPCVQTACGDGVVQGDERCDDGNTQAFDGCNSLCQQERYYTCPSQGGACSSASACGNQLIEGGESCDDGALLDGDGCSAACQVEPGYRCPPGLPCGPACPQDFPGSEVAGNDGGAGEPDLADAAVMAGGASAPAPRADAGLLLLGDASVTAAVGAEPTEDVACLPLDQGLDHCGDGVVAPGEQCDDGINATLYGAGCAPGCRTPAICGDGIADGFAGEECDLGATRNDGSYGGCTAECRRAPHCGDGTVDAEEQCDEGLPACDNCRETATR